MGGKLLFILYPTPEAARRFYDFALHLRDLHRLTTQPVSAGRLHVTLAFLGRYTTLGDAPVDAVRSAAATVRMRPFQIGFDRYLSFRSGATKPLVLAGGEGVPGVYELHDAIVAALAREGFAMVGRTSFTPHLTLLRDAVLLPQTFTDVPSWRADSFALIWSPDRVARHDVLARWPLTTAPLP